MKRLKTLVGEPDLFGFVTPVEPTRQEVVSDTVCNRIRVDRYCSCGCDRWLIRGEEVYPNDDRFDGPLSIPCAVQYGYFTPRERKPR